MPRVENGCIIYLQFGSRIVIPVNPEEIEIQHPSDHKTYSVLEKGEIVVPRRPSLQVVSWESFFPGHSSDPYVNRGAKDPEFYDRYLREALENRTVGRLIITRSALYDTNIRCIVSDYQTTDKGGEPEDIYYSLELKEYRDHKPKTVAVIAEPAADQPQAEVSAETERPVETPVLRVGASVIANGQYWYDSYGSKPFGTANNLSTTITRIVEGNPYPIHVGHYGWLKESQLQIVG